MKKFLVTLLIVTISASMLVGCSKKEPRQEEHTPEIEVSEPIESEEEIGEETVSGNEETIIDEEVSSDKEDTTFMNLSGTNISKSVQLIDKVSETNKGNIMFSPLSLNMALGLLQEGTADDSASDEALDSYLGGNYGDFAENYMANIEQFNRPEVVEGYKTVFEIANSVWIDKQYELNSGYKDSVEGKYQAKVDNIDKADPSQSASDINNWCSDNTHELIKSIVTEDMMQDITSVLVNTVYLESAWSEEWSAPYEEVEFPNLDGTTSDVLLMRNTLGTYYENDKATAFGARYRNRMTFIGILPKQEGDFQLQDLDLESLLESKVDTNIDVYAGMPELEFETEMMLGNILRNTELAPIFDSKSLDINGICKDPVFVNDIIQKTKLELDCHGTKAAAVTAVMIETCGIIMEENREEEVILNRPFAFMIYDDINNVPVFIGKVTNMK